MVGWEEGRGGEQGTHARHVACVCMCAHVCAHVCAWVCAVPTAMQRNTHLTKALTSPGWHVVSEKEGMQKDWKMRNMYASTPNMFKKCTKAWIHRICFGGRGGGVRRGGVPKGGAAQ